MKTLRREALFQLGLGIAALAVLTAAYPAPGVLALAAFAVIAVLVLRGLPTHGHASFGPANTVTLVRAALTCALAGLLVAEPIPLLAAAAIGGIAILLDGLDGLLARRSGLSSPFGARFDMELDAALILVLAALVVSGEKAGFWTLALGALRYLWIGAGLLWPPLAQPLPPSHRRRAVCAAVVTSLVSALAAPAWLASLLCSLALFLLMYSFSVDFLWVLRSGSRQQGRCEA